MTENATLWSSGSGFKIIMGSGTKLIVQTREYYFKQLFLLFYSMTFQLETAFLVFNLIYFYFSKGREMNDDDFSYNHHL